MSRFYRYIQTFSLFLAVFVITAHAIIPHDHHQSVSFSGGEESCQVNNSKTSHHPGFPLHCHAFNVLTFEKFIINFVPENIQQKDIIIISIISSISAYIQLTYITIHEIKESFPTQGIIGVSQLRAPPAIF